MAYSETKTTNYGSRVSSSFKGIGFGFTLFISATILLWWNEGRAVHTAADIKEVAQAAMHIDNINTVAPDGKLIHANGIAQTNDTLRDPVFNVAVKALSLERNIEYYQWIEHATSSTKENVGGSKDETTTYTYKCDWVSKPVDSSNFHDPNYRGRNSNMSNIVFENKDVYASNVYFGAYKLPSNFIPHVAHCAQKINVNIKLEQEMLDELNRAVDEAQSVSAHISNNISNIVTNDTSTYKWVHVYGNQIYLGRNASSPNVGDVRINFTCYEPTAEISLIAVVNGKSLTDYQTKNNKSQNYITRGTKSLEQMIKSAEEDNSIWTWVLRVIGVLLVCLALKLMVGVLVTLLKVVPFLANILDWGISIICYIIGVLYSLIVIALAWIFYRPLFGVCLIAIALGVAGGMAYWTAARKKKETPTV